MLQLTECGKHLAAEILDNGGGRGEGEGGRVDQRQTLHPYRPGTRDNFAEWQQDRDTQRRRGCSFVIPEHNVWGTKILGFVRGGRAILGVMSKRGGGQECQRRSRVGCRSARAFSELEFSFYHSGWFRALLVLQVNKQAV